MHINFLSLHHRSKHVEIVYQVDKSARWLKMSHGTAVLFYEHYAGTIKSLVPRKMT